MGRKFSYAGDGVRLPLRHTGAGVLVLGKQYPAPELGRKAALVGISCIQRKTALKHETKLHETSRSIRPDNREAFRSAGGGKNERQTDGCRQNSNDYTEGYCAWEMPCQAALSQDIFSPTKIRMSAKP